MVTARVEQRDKILQYLEDPAVSRIVVSGQSGMGKTFLAREIADQAIENRLCFETIWLSLNRRHGQSSVYETMAHHLSVLLNYEELDEEDGSEEKEKEKETIENLMEKIAREIKRKKESAEEMFLLVIMDDAGKKTSEEQVMTEFGLKDFLTNLKVPWKVLTTRTTKDESSVSGTETVELVGLNLEASCRLFQSFLAEKVSSELGLDVSSVAKKSDGVPAGITVLAKSLSYMARHGSMSLSPTLTKVFRRNGMLVGKREEEEEVYVEAAAITGCDLLLLLSYQTLTSDATVNCLRQSLRYFEKHGGVYYRDLVNHWILEGYFDPVESMKTSYQDAFNVQTELLERGMLKIQEDSMVIPEERMRSVFDLLQTHGGNSSLRLTDVTHDNDQICLGTTVLIDDIIKKVTAKNVSMVMVSGNRLRKEIPKDFFEKMPDLKAVALFSPAFDSLVPSLWKLKKLSVLVIRDCNVLDDIDAIADLESLTALEISGAGALKGNLRDSFFRKMAHLQSLNLSRNPFQYLPSSVSLLKELSYLILRHCPKLKHLPNLQFMENLEVIDTYGSTSLSVSDEENHNTNFFRLKRLQRLDFSRSKLIRIPLFQNTGLRWSGYREALTHLILRDCIKLTRLPSLKPLSGLEVLDLSGCVGVHEIRNAYFEEKKKLRVLDLSGTSISALPSSSEKLYSLRELILRDCLSLTSLPRMDDLTSLEVIDVSNCRTLTKIDGTFEFMPRLENLSLSGTKVTSLPAFPKSGSLRKLLLKGCSSLTSLSTSKDHSELRNLEVLNISGCHELKNLPELTRCKKLKIIDCSGCIALDINAESFSSMPNLEKLDLSGTNIKKVSDLPRKCRDISRLLLKNCTVLEDVVGLEHLRRLQELNLGGIRCLNDGKAEFLEHLTELESLDLSGVNLSEFSSISKLNNLRNLSLIIDQETADTELFSPLKHSNHLEVLRLSGTSVTAEFLNKNCDSLCAKRIVLSNVSILKELNWVKFAIRGSVKEISWEDHGFSVHLATVLANKKPSLHVVQLVETKTDDRQNICCKELNVSVCLKEQCSNHSMSCPRELYGYEEIFINILGFARGNQHEPCLEIHGGDGSGNFPNLIKTWISKAEYVSFIDNLSTSCSSILSPSKAKALKGCLVQRCVKMEDLFGDEETEPQIQQLEALQISNLTNLTKICGKTGMFQNLKKLSLECCPKIETCVFQASQTPKYLEILQIKFCDKLKRVFEEDCELQSLHTLILFCLQELLAVGARLPPGQRLRVCRVDKCPNLKDTEESLSVTPPP